MIHSRKTLNWRLLVAAFAVLTIGLGCLCSGSTLIPAISATPTQQLPPTQPGVTPLEPPTSAPESTPTQASQGLNDSGPWLLAATADGLWAADPDGSGLVQLVQGSNWQSDLTRAVQPGGNLVVVLTSQGDSYHHLALNLLSLPDGRLQKVTDLTTPQTEPGPSASPGDTALEAVRAIAEQDSYAWSPDGSKLAFIGVMDGPSAEVYLYHTASNAITRVTHDDGQDFSPSWSPDGAHLLFFGADGFGTGAGMVMNGVWTASGDGSNVTSLYKPDSSGELIAGWRDNQTAVLESWSPAYGPSQLRLYDVTTRATTLLQEGAVAGAAVASASSADPGAVMFSKDDGLYLLHSGQDQPEKLIGNPVSSIKWVQDSPMFEVAFSDNSLATYEADGADRQDAPFKLSGSLNGPSNVAMYGAIWAWTNPGTESEGVWISGPGLETTQIFSGPASGLAWDLHNNLLFFSAGGLYRATFDKFYTDAARVAGLSGDVQDVTWAGMK